MEGLAMYNSTEGDMFQFLLDGDANQKSVPSELTADYQSGLQQPLPEGTQYADASGLVLDSTRSSKAQQRRSPRRGLLAERNARPRRFRSQNWSAEEKQAFVVLKEKAQGFVSGKDWDYISQELRNEHSFARDPKSCENQWGTLLKYFKAIQKHQHSLGATGWCSYWDKDAVANYKKKNKLPPSFPEELYAVMKRIIASKSQGGGEPQRRRAWEWRPPVDREVDASLYHLADPIARCGSGQHIDVGSGMLDLRDTPWLPDDGEGQSTTWLAPFVNHEVEDAVYSALDNQIRPGYEESIPGATYENDDLVTSLSSHLTQVIQDPVNLAVEDYMSDKAAIDKDALIPLIKQLIAVEVRFAMEPISSSLLAQMRDDRMFEQDVRVLAKKKRALAREEEVLLKRHRVANRRPTAAARKSQGIAILPTFQGLNITSAEDLSPDHLSHEADSGLVNMLV